MHLDPTTVAVVVFVVTYAGIVSEKIDRTAVAMAGALALVFLGVVSQEQAVESIDFNTLGLLTGMMVIVSLLRSTGFFRLVGVRIAHAAGGRPLPILLIFVVVTAVLSALLDNVTTVLLMLPVTLTISEHLKMDPRPFLISQVIASNVGGTATLIGDPPNILIGSALGLTFNEFLVNLGPVVLVNLVMLVAIYAISGRKAAKATKGSGDAVAALAALDTKSFITHPAMMIKALAVTGLTVLGFLFHGALHLEPATVALGGATLLVLIGRVSAVRALEEVEWATLFFFIGLFIVVGGLERTGVLERVAAFLMGLTGGDLVLAAIALLWFAAIVSAIVDNIPAVATLIPIVLAVSRLAHPGVPDDVLVRLPDIFPLWWALALGACLGGNATLVGASANVVVAGAAARRGVPITFWAFTKAGLPITVGTLVVSTVYLWVRYLA